MKKHEYSTVPHSDLIVENGNITIPSLFMFGKDTSGLFLFITSCREKNCTLTFENEGLTFNPTEYDSDTNMILSCYLGIMARPKLAFNYMRYLSELNEMTWDNVKKGE